MASFLLPHLLATLLEFLSTDSGIFVRRFPFSGSGLIGCGSKLLTLAGSPCC